MTRYSVVWHELAQDDLAEIWMKALDREAVSKAANALDEQLASDPLAKGRQVSERSRELTLSPLHVLFRVRVDDRKVEVFSVTPV